MVEASRYWLGIRPSFGGVAGSLEAAGSHGIYVIVTILAKGQAQFGVAQ